MADYSVSFEPVGRQGSCSAGQSLLHCARLLGVGLVSICRDRGTCYECRVRVIQGTVSEPKAAERRAFSPLELEQGWRLACQAYPQSDCTVSVPAASLVASQRTQVEGQEVEVSPEPLVLPFKLTLESPTLADPLADADRVLAALDAQHGLPDCRVDSRVLRELSPRLRRLGWQGQAALRQGEVIAMSPWPSRHLGLAVDLGTTKIAGYLVDLGTGQTLAARGMANPQASYGGDVVSRINAAMESPSTVAQLQSMVTAAINELVQRMCAEAKVEAEEIVDAVVVGNTAMHHLWLRLPVRQLAYSPFTPAIARALDIKAHELGLEVTSGAYVHLLPNIAGFVGGDHVAMLLATNVWQDEGPSIALDIGTNTEISLLDRGSISSVSCASGPAFEGGHVKDGMRATTGAIERMRLENGDILYQTVDDAPPVGLCGSGILDAMAQMYLAGVLDRSGRMKQEHPLVRRRGQQCEFVVVSEAASPQGLAITITQSDIRELQMAKASIRAGIQVLLEAAGHQEEDLRQVIIAGAFGSYIDVESACTIGMLPSLPLERFRQVGNAAGIGAKLALVSASKRAMAETIATRAHYIELARAANFMSIFAGACYLGPGKIELAKRGGRAARAER
ncbi:MAG: DUF4445 domain-containing protein [Chloroflexi bacterium]|nr:DUF4445 domain-containing protein [Chloroflexota bacterium]